MPKQSTGQKRVEKFQQDGTKPLFYDDTERKAYNFYIDRCKSAKKQRDQVYTEFDDLTYEQDYRLNERASNSYLKVKKNDAEVRIVSGTTEKKIEVVENELASLNFQPEVLAFDKEDNEMVELGHDFTDIVSRTNQIERDDDMWQEAVKELLTQRACFIEEIFNDKEVQDKKTSKQGQFGREPVKFTKKPERIQRAEKRVLSGLQVYLGNISIPAYRFNDQPYIVKYDRMLYEEAELIYGKWKNWDKVKKGRQNIKDFGGDFKYRMNILEDEEVEILHYISFPDDEYMIIINGVMMLEPGTPLPWEQEGYNIGMFVLKSINRNFAYGKPLTASAKTLQGLNDETIRLLIRKFRQAIQPPLATKGKKVYSKDIWQEGAITQGLSADEFERLTDHNGVTNSEMEMQQFIKGLTEEFIGASNLLQGIGEPGSQTARESLALLRQGIKQLGQSVLATVRMKRDVTYLRIYNVLQNYTTPIKKRKNEQTGKIEDVYRKFTIKDAEFENGERGTKIVQFMDRDLEDEERQDIFDFTERAEARGRPLRIRTINVKKLRDLNTLWFVVVNSEEKESSELQKILFTDSLNQAAAISQISGKPLNGGRLIQEFERKWQVKDYFQKEAPGGAEGGGNEEVKQQADQLLKQIGNSEIGGDLRENRPDRPTLQGVEEAG